MTTALDEGYRICEQVSRASSSSFLWSFRVLPREQRRAMCALYAFSRLTDDLADSGEPEATRRPQLACWRAMLADALQGDYASPLWHALHDTTVRFSIPTEYLFAIVDGVAMDLTPPDYETFGELRNYCYHVASAVGLSCIHIFGFQDERAKVFAEECGIAFQMTNILRDLAEDAAHGRIYLPRQEMAEFGCLPEDFERRETNSQLRDLLQFQLDRTGRLYDEAASLPDFLQPRGRRAFILMYSTYRTLFEEIKRRDGDVFSQPVRLGYIGKFRALVSALRFQPVKPALLDRTPDLRPQLRATTARGETNMQQSGR